jgi:hypothetical protein
MTLKQLLEIARGHLLPLTTVADADFRLEQAEFNKKDAVWEIIVSFLVENTNKKANPLTALASGFQFHRMYKKVKIKANGDFEGFYIYNNKE